MAENMLEVIKKNDPALYNQMMASKSEDFESIGMVQRLPKIRVSHGNAIFVFPNDETTKKLEGVILKVGAFKELYDNDTEEQKAPICASVDSPEGSKYGLCASCPHWVWGTGNNGVGRNCSESLRLLISIKGHPQPFEMKVSTNSVPILKKAIANAMATTNLGLPYLDFSATLQVESKGNQKWSVIQPRFEKPENLAETAVARAQLRETFKTYFVDVYGRMNATGTDDYKENAVDKKPTAEGAEVKTAATKKSSKKTKQDVEDAEIVASNETMDEVPF